MALLLLQCLQNIPQVEPSAGLSQRWRTWDNLEQPRNFVASMNGHHGMVKHYELAQNQPPGKQMEQLLRG